MFIRYYRTESAMQFILLLLTGLLLWFPSLIHPLPSPLPVSPLPFYETLIQWIGSPGYLNVILALALILTEGIILTLLLSKHDLFPRNNALPAILYTILMSWHPALLSLNPAILANILLLAFLYMFLKAYERPDAFKEVFSACFLLSVTSLFDSYMAAFFLLIWIGFLVYRLFDWRTWVISLLGLSLPYLYLFMYYFWHDRLGDLLEAFRLFFQQIKYMEVTLSPVLWIAVITLAFILFVALLKIAAMLQEKVISIRKKFLFLIWFFLLSLPILIFSGKNTWVLSAACMIPATALLAYHLNKIKKLFWWEVLFFILMGCLILMRFFPLI